MFMQRISAWLLVNTRVLKAEDISELRRPAIRICENYLLKQVEVSVKERLATNPKHSKQGSQGTQQMSSHMPIKPTSVSGANIID